MELKKSNKADLESKRSIFLLVGLVISLGVCFMAFEWKSSVEEVEDLGALSGVEVEDEIIPITRQEEVKPPPPPPPPKVVEVLTIVDDDTELDDELEIEDTEADDETIIEATPVLQEEEELDEAKVFFVVEEMPEFPGGERALIKYINSHVEYPVIAQENGVQGRVTINFVVETDGRVTEASVLRPVDPALDQEAMRVVNSMPRWKPGKQRGKPVRVSFRVPIIFKLQ